MSLTRQGSRYNQMAEFDPKKDKANKGDNKDNKDNKGDDTLKGTGLMNVVVFPITKYEGDPETLVEFLEEYNLFADSYGWKEPQKCSRLPLHVKGTARQIVLSLPKEDREDWKRLGAALTKAILTVTPARTHRAKFRVRIQRPNETVTQFAYDLKNLAIAALATINAESREELLFEQFMHGLHKDIRTQVTIADVQTFEEALQKAQLIENLQEITDEVHVITEAKHEQPSNGSNHNHNYTNRPRPPYQNNDTNYRGRSNYRGNSRGVPRGGYRGNDGFRGQNQNYNNFRANVNNEGQMKCDKCKRYGHTARTCKSNQSYFPRDGANQYGRNQYLRNSNVPDNSYYNNYIPQDNGMNKGFYSRGTNLNPNANAYVPQDYGTKNIKRYPNDGNKNETKGASKVNLIIDQKEKEKREEIEILKDDIRELTICNQRLMERRKEKLENKIIGTSVSSEFNTKSVTGYIDCQGEIINMNTPAMNESRDAPFRDDLLRLGSSNTVNVLIPSELENSDLTNNVITVLSTPNIPKAQIKEVLDKLLTLTITQEELTKLIPLLLQYAEENSPYRSTVKILLQRYGQELRRTLLRSDRITLKLDMPNKQLKELKVHPFTLVKKVRQKIQEELKTNDIILLLFYGQQLDDDEYIIECGALPYEVNKIKVITVTPLQNLNTFPEEEFFQYVPTQIENNTGMNQVDMDDDPQQETNNMLDWLERDNEPPVESNRNMADEMPSTSQPIEVVDLSNTPVRDAPVRDERKGRGRPRKDSLPRVTHDPSQLKMLEDNLVRVMATKLNKVEAPPKVNIIWMMLQKFFKSS